MPDYAIEVTEVTCPACFMCHKRAVVTVPTEALARWRAGELIQVAFPELPTDQREMLVTGTHPACWTKMFETDE